MTDCMLIVYQVFTKFWFPWEKYTYMAIKESLDRKFLLLADHMPFI